MFYFSRTPLPRLIAVLVLFSLLVSACGMQLPGAAADPAAPDFAGTLPAPLQITDLPLATPVSTDFPPTDEALYIHPAVPLFVREMAAATVPLPITEDSAAASLSIQPIPEGDAQSLWVYTLVAPLPTLEESVTFDELRAFWAGSSSGAFSGRSLVMDEFTLGAMTLLLGPPADGVARVVPNDKVMAAAWAQQPAVWAIVPFESLETEWKVIAIDGNSPIHKEFDQVAYPLKMGFSFVGVRPEGVVLPATNRDPSLVTTLMMTGVTALVRAAAYRMEKSGILFPEQDIGDLLRSADVLHISNEIPFADGCPFPDPGQIRIIFCSDPKYIELLESIGTDVVELTGNHFADWGTAATLMTMDMYDARGWPYYGGGRDLADSQKAAIIEHNGNKLAFIGCNPVGPDFAWATDYRPGAAPCDDLAWMTGRITELKEQGYIPVATFQHYEYYTPEPRPNQLRDFRAMVDAGADIISGSQAHSPQAMEFYKGTFIHYGLGNLFFDQMHTDKDTRKEFADRYVIYDGKVISVEFFTFMLEDYSRPRYMTLEERNDLLTYIWSYTDWSIFP